MIGLRMRHADHAPLPSEVRAHIRLSLRDQAIIALTRRKLFGLRVDFTQAVQALHEAVAETIPYGRIFLLGTSIRGPILGSLISGVGIVQGEEAVELMQLVSHGSPRRIGMLCP